MENWSRSKRQEWKRFWNSEMGKEAIRQIELVRDGLMEEALTLPDRAVLGGNVNDMMLRAITKANGVDKVLEMILSTTHLK